MIKILLFFFKPHLVLCIVLSLIFFLSSAIETLTIGTAYPLLSSIMQGAQPTVPMQGKILEFISKLSTYISVQDSMIANCILVIVLNLISNILGFVSDALARFYHLKFVERYMALLYESILKKPYSYFLKNKHGDIMYRGLNASLSVGEVFHYGPRTLVELLRAVSIMGLLFSISWPMTLILCVAALVFGLLYHFFATYITYPYANRIRVVVEAYTSHYSESISGIKQIKVFSNFDYFLKKFKVYLKEERYCHTTSLILAEVPPRLIKILSITVLLSAMIYSKLQSPETFAQVLPLVAVFLVAIQRMLPAIINMGTNWIGFKELLPRLTVAYEVLTGSVTVNDKNKSIERIDSISLNHLSFSYNQKEEKEALHDISFQIPVKKTTALVGKSGAGKSTLIDLLIGLYRPTRGTIEANGMDLSEINQESWLEKIAIVSQDPFLFHCSISDNIKLGKLNATEEEIITAAKLANAHDFIMALPLQYSTVLGDRGVTLSGGQRQRIAMAKALIRNPEILIMDEATSALDNISEQVFRDNLKGLQNKMTIIMIAHRLSTVEHADHIVVLNEGKVVETGRHQELLGKRGLYSDLYQHQGAV